MGLVPELVAVHGAFGLWKLKAGEAPSEST